MTALFGLRPELLIQPMMLIGIGFLLAAVIAVAFSPLIHRRAERLTKRRLETHIPQNVHELRAEKDHLRAAHAVEARNMTLGMEKLQEKAALQGAELGRRTEEAHRLKIAIQEKEAKAAQLQRRVDRFDEDTAELRAEIASAQFEASAGRLALREAEQAILSLQAEIADLTTAVETRSRLIDRQQHDIMALTAQVERLRKAPPVAAPVVQPAAIAQQMAKQNAAQPVMQAAAPAPVRAAPAAASAANGALAAGTVSFESRLAAIRDDKPLRDVRPQVAAKRAVAIEPAPKTVQKPAQEPAAKQFTKSQFLNSLLTKPEMAKEIVKVAQASVEKPAAKPKTPDAEPARVSTDIRYDEPLTTSDLLELGKAMLRQASKDGLPHKTH